MTGFYDSSGREGSLQWKVIQTGDRVFLLTVNQGSVVRTRRYNCEYPTLFGLDAIDNQELNVLLDSMIEEVRSINQ